MPSVSNDNLWNIQHILSEGAKYVMGDALISCLCCEPGSKIRRAGYAGRQRWSAVWKQGRGFDTSESFIRVYVDEDKVEDFQRLVDQAPMKYKTKEWENCAMPATGPTMGFVDVAKILGCVYVIDGMHRTVTLVDAHLKWVAGHPDDDVTSSPFYLLRAVFYHPKVKSIMAVFAKAANDQKQVHVPEDSWEKVTLTLQVIASYENAVKDPRKQGDRDIAKHYMEQVGCPNTKAINYHSQLVSMAKILKPISVWITGRLTQLEEEGGHRAEVFMSQTLPV